jgi:hypothetical protein
MAKEGPLTAGPRFCEVQPIDHKASFSPPPLGVSPRNGLAPSPKRSHPLLYILKPFASTLACIRIHFCEKALYLTLSLAATSETHIFAAMFDKL